jgi:hypothetical protein
MIASLVYHDRRTATLRTPYNAAFVEHLKQAVHASYREWMPTEKLWRVDTPYDRVAAEILRFFYPDAEIKARPLFEPTSASSHGCRCDADHRALYVCQGAPAEVIKAAYKALALLNHPVRGGDVAFMQGLNAAFERLTAEARS